MSKLNFTPKSVWNIDNDRLRILSIHMAFCDEAFVDWNLEDLYIYLHSIKRISSPKLRKNKKDWDKLKEKFKRLEEKRREMYNDFENENIKIEFYNLCDNIYEEINSQLQEHGVFFREGMDPSKAALRR